MTVFVNWQRSIFKEAPIRRFFEVIKEESKKRVFRPAFPVAELIRQRTVYTILRTRSSTITSDGGVRGSRTLMELPTRT